MSSVDDTQPRFPKVEPPFIQPPDEDEDLQAGGPGCLIWGVVGVLAAGFAVLIVVLAGAAGWTSGQRIAGDNATATQNAEIRAQLERIPDDINSGNLVLLEARLQYLATLTPGVTGVPELALTATALYDGAQVTPTATATATITPAADATTPPPPQAENEPTISAVGFDLATLLEEARSAVALGQWQNAIDLLDAIIAIDSTYESATVRGLMLDALSRRALGLFRTGESLAEAVLLTDRAKEFGLPTDSELHFEQYVATLYLNASSAIGTNYSTAIRALNELLSVAPNYRNGEVRRLLFNQYVAYGDAYVAEGNHCAAVPQYQNALNLFNDVAVTAKRSAAETTCAQGTPVVPVDPADPNATPQPIAPIGVPGT